MNLLPLGKIASMKTLSIAHSACSRILPAIVLIGICFTLTTASAAVFTWDGGGANNNWNTNLNWAGDTAPTLANFSTTDFVFGGTTRLSSVNNVTTSATNTVQSITFNAGAGAFTLSGSNVNTNKLTLGTGGVSNQSSNLQTISMQTLVTGTTTIDTGTSGIAMTGNFNGSNATALVTKTGNGQLTFNGPLSGYSGTVSVDVGSVLLSGGGLGSANFSMNGGTLISDPALTAQAVNNLTFVSNSGSVKTGGQGAVGTFNVANDMTMAFGNTVDFDIASDTSYDMINVGNQLTYGGVLNLALSGTYANGTVMQLFTFGSFTGDLDSIASIGSTGSWAGITFSTPAVAGDWTSDWSGDHQKVVFSQSTGQLTVVPEPSTIVFAGIGMAMFGWSTWTRRRAAARRETIDSAIV